MGTQFGGLIVYLLHKSMALKGGSQEFGGSFRFTLTFGMKASVSRQEEDEMEAMQNSTLCETSEHGPLARKSDGRTCSVMVRRRRQEVR